MCKECEKFHVEHPWDDEKHRHEGTIFVSQVTCVFDVKGRFTRTNWNCRGIAPFREKTDYSDREVWAEDQHVTVVRFDEFRHLVLSYYKHHGATEGAWIVNGGLLEELTQAELEKAEVGRWW